MCPAIKVAVTAGPPSAAGCAAEPGAGGRCAGPGSARSAGSAPASGRDAMGELAVDIPWQKGDVMLLDNLRSMHARRPFTPPRRILAYLCL